ncbi:hypothetical protein HZC34_01895 [Candidatus Saganbacteria bacterium]|nr:hypothetical protein [Candidatus Saganbacteria bacterium]
MNTSAPISNQNTVKVDDYFQNSESGRMDDSGYIQNFEEYYDAKKSAIYAAGGDFTNSKGSFQVADGKNLGALYDLNNTRDYLSLNLAVYNETRRELNEMLFEINFQKAQISDAKKSKKPSQIETALKSISLRDEMYNQGVSSIMSKIQTYNQAVLNNRNAEIDEEASEWHDSLPFCDDEDWRAEEKKKITDEFNAAMQESYSQLNKAVNQKGLAGLNGDFSTRATDAFNGLNTGLYQNDGSGDYIDVPSLRKSIDELKKKLTNILNVQRHILASREVKADAGNLIFEASNEVKGSDSKAKAYQQLFEKEAGRTMSVFNTQSTNLIAIAKLTNQSRYMQKQIDKLNSAGYQFLHFMGSFLQVAALVVAIVGAIFSWTGIGAVLTVAAISAAAALSKWGASKIADIQDDVQDPSNTRIIDNKALDKAKDKSKESQMEAVENRIIANIDSKYQDRIDDGYKAMDYAAIGLEYKALSGVQNAIRLLNEAKKMKANLNNLVFSAHTGLRGINSPAILNSVLESHFEIKKTEFQFTVANQQDIVDAFNMKHAQEIQMDNATRIMGISLGLAVVSAALGAGIGYGVSKAFEIGAEAAVSAGISIGFALGQGIGTGIADLYNNKWSDTAAYGINYSGSIGKIRAHYMEQSVNTTVDKVTNDAKSTKAKNREAAILGKAEQLENEALANLAANGIADAGDGYSTINTETVKRSLAMLNIAADVRALIAAMHETKNEIANMFSAVSANTPNTISAINRSNLQKNLQISNYIKQHLQEQITVSKRAHEADKAVTSAYWKIGVTAVVAGACLGIGAAGVGVVASLTTAIVGAANIITDLVTNAAYANKGNGQIRAPQGKQKSPDLQNKSALEQIDSMETGRDFDMSMTENLGGGRIGINSGNLTIMENQTFTNMRVAIMISDARRALSDIQNTIAAAYGSSTASASDAASRLVSNKQTFLLQGLQVKLQAMQHYIERQNQKADYTRAIWQKSFDLGMAAVQIAVGTVSDLKQNKIDKMITDPVTEDNKTAPLSEAERTEVEKLADSKKSLAIASVAISIVNTLADTLIGAIYDSGRRGKEISERISKDAKTFEDNNKVGSSSNNVSSKEIDGAAQDIITDETEKEALFSGDAELLKETTEINYRTSQEIAQSIMNLIKSGADGYKTLKSNKVLAKLIEYSKARTELKRNEDEAYKRLGSISVDLAKKYKDSVNIFKAAEAEYSHTANAQTQAKLLMAYADMIAAISEIEIQLASLEQSLASLQAKKDASERILKESDKDSDAPIFNNPDFEQLRTEDQVKQNIDAIRKEIKAAISAKAKLETAKTKEQIAAVTAEMLPHEAALAAALTDLPNTVVNSRLMASVAENLAPIDFKAQIEAKEKVALKEISLDDIKDPDMLQQIYQDLYINNFVPARETKQAAALLKNLIMKKLKGEDLSQEELVKAKNAIEKLGTFASKENMQLITPMIEALAAKGPVSVSDSGRLNILRGEAEQVEGTARQSIKSFNKLSGKIDSKVKSLGRKGGLTPINEAMLAIPVSAASAGTDENDTADLSDLFVEIDGKLAVTDKLNKVLQNQLELLSSLLAEAEKEAAYA